MNAEMRYQYHPSKMWLAGATARQWDQGYAWFGQAYTGIIITKSPAKENGCMIACSPISGDGGVDVTGAFNSKSVEGADFGKTSDLSVRLMALWAIGRRNSGLMIGKFEGSNLK